MNDPRTSPSTLIADLARIAAGLGALALAVATVARAGRGRDPARRAGPGRARSLDELLGKPRQSRPRRKPPEAGMPTPAVSPRGPSPKQGGAAALMRFEAE